MIMTLNIHQIYNWGYESVHHGWTGPTQHTNECIPTSSILDHIGAQASDIRLSTTILHSGTKWGYENHGHVNIHVGKEYICDASSFTYVVHTTCEHQKSVCVNYHPIFPSKPSPLRQGMSIRPWGAHEVYSTINCRISWRTPVIVIEVFHNNRHALLHTITACGLSGMPVLHEKRTDTMAGTPRMEYHGPPVLVPTRPPCPCSSALCGSRQSLWHGRWVPMLRCCGGCPFLRPCKPHHASANIHNVIQTQASDEDVRGVARVHILSLCTCSMHLAMK